MNVFVVLVIAMLVARLLGALGVRRLASWPTSAAHGLAVMLVLTASAHFIPVGVTAMPNHADMVTMVPPFVPFASTVVYATGTLELVGAAGLVLPRTRRMAGLGLALLFVLMFPANVYAVVADVPYNEGEATPLWLRVPMQIIYVSVALWVARRSDVAPSRQAAAPSHTGAAQPVV